ncbi:MAG: ATP-binding protein, partial [Actinomycetota bacterium]
KAGAILQELRGEASEAVETLRDLARGLFPEILTEQGLRSALLSHIAKMNLNARVEGEIGRFDLEIEANVYFCIREALQNASKHAPAAEVLIALSAQDDHLAFSVKDEGPGFDVRSIRMGSGLQNMADRVEALGGTFEIVSAPGLGTDVRGQVPSRAPVVAR